MNHDSNEATDIHEAVNSGDLEQIKTILQNEGNEAGPPH